jgi:hypothetical protein
MVRVIIRIKVLILCLSIVLIDLNDFCVFVKAAGFQAIQNKDFKANKRKRITEMTKKEPFNFPKAVRRR